MANLLQVDWKFEVTWIDAGRPGCRVTAVTAFQCPSLSISSWQKSCPEAERSLDFCLLLLEKCSLSSYLDNWLVIRTSLNIKTFSCILLQPPGGLPKSWRCVSKTASKLPLDCVKPLGMLLCFDFNHIWTRVRDRPSRRALVSRAPRYTLAPELWISALHRLHRQMTRINLAAPTYDFVLCSFDPSNLCH